MKPEQFSVAHCVRLSPVSAVLPETSSFLFHLLLLTELLVRSSSLPLRSSSHCGFFGSMIHQVESLMNLSRKIHQLVRLVLNFLDLYLPDLYHTAGHLKSLKVNESFTQMYGYTQSFKLHIDWLKVAKENVSLPFQTEEGASSHLLQLSNLIEKLKTDSPSFFPAVPSTAPNLPVVSNAFDALVYSVEISDRLKVFCVWSKRVLRYFQKHS
uniref:Interleukin 11a n=1 Tax=Xiphophorus couchianus TaxID=32473 RepID=A0A3B5MVM9_9TELE